MKKKISQLLRVVVFCAILLGLVVGASFLLERKLSMDQLRPYMETAEEYDVLFVGDSQVINGVFPMELWQDYGIASYNLASYGNTLPVSYWTMMNALDYGTPKLIVLGVKDAERGYKLSGSSSDVHTALDGYPLSRTKIAAIEDLMADSYDQDDDGNYYSDFRWEYYFTLGKYHSRWSELGGAYFTYEPNQQKGAKMATGVGEPDDYDIIDEWETMEEDGYGFLYLRRIIEECQSRDIDVLLMHLPYPSTENEQRSANTVLNIADQYGVDFIDFVQLDQVADYETDCYDAHSHLNPSGARKVTDYLGRYIVDHYDIPDRREDAAYAHWKADYAVYKQIKLDTLDAGLTDALMLLHDPHFSLCLVAKGGALDWEDERTLTLMQNIAREHVFEEDAYSKWSNAMFPLEELDAAAEDGESYLLILDRKNGAQTERCGDIALDAQETGFGVVSCDADGSITIAQNGAEQTYRADDTNIMMLIIDDETGEVAKILKF